MIGIRVFMNSAVEEILSFKCCNLHDQNLEIHLENRENQPVTVPGCCELVAEEDDDRYRIDTLYPPGPYVLDPGEVRACYGTLTDQVYEQYRWIVFRDGRGGEHRAPLHQDH